MKNIILLSAVALWLLAIGGCEKTETLPPYQAKGTVLGITGPCRGNGTYIEVEIPKNIGKESYFFPDLDKNDITNCKNAICVPHFYKVDLPIELQEKGTWLHFEYRKYNKKTDEYLFQHKEHCTFEQGPPAANIYIITKIISSKTKK